jgi:amino acid permease
MERNSLHASEMTFFTEPDQVRPELGIIGGAFNIANTIIGVGIIGLPNVLRQFGIPIGACLLIFVAILTFSSVYLLLLSK